MLSEAQQWELDAGWERYTECVMSLGVSRWDVTVSLLANQKIWVLLNLSSKRNAFNVYNLTEWTTDFFFTL